MNTLWIRTSLRNLLKHKGFTSINVVGMAVGLACVMFIFLWVQDELSMNRFHPDIDRIWQVMEHQAYADGVVFTVPNTPGLMAEELRTVLPEVEAATVFTWQQMHLFGTGPDAVRREGLYADHQFITVFGWQVLEGDGEAALVEPNSLVLTHRLATILFPEGGALGQSVVVNDRTPHKVTAVIADPPSNSSFTFNYLLPFSDFVKENDWLNFWGNNGPQTTIKLKPGVDGHELSGRLTTFIKDRNEGSLVEVFLQPFADSYLYSRFENRVVVGGPIEYVRLFALIAGFVLLIACINFMNLSTARSVTRAREVGVRKAVGGSRGAIAAQFIGEAVILCVLAMALAVILVELLLPGFNDLTRKAVSLEYGDPTLWLGLIGFSVFTGILAGSYPAMNLSAFQPVDVLKGTIRHSASGRFIRQGLVVVQFTVSMVLIVGMIVIYQQIGHIRNQSLGYDTEQVGFVPLEGELALGDNRLRFRDALRDLPGVANVGLSNSIMVGRNSNTSSVQWPGRPPDVNILFEILSVDESFPETMGFELAQGRFFSEDRADAGSSILINEAAVAAMGVDNPIGMLVRAWGAEREVVGVLKDFNYTSLHSKVEPLIMLVMPSNAWVAMIRLNAGEPARTLEAVEAVYKRFNPSYPFVFTFQEERIQRLYRREAMIGSLSRWFGGVAILVSCLGLFGLSVFTTEQRSKEISIRKVLGASVGELVLMLTGEFSRLVLLAIVISTPLAWWLMDRWLSAFTYRIDVGWTTLAAAGIVALGISWLTVSSQSLKAAVSNPADTLRDE